MAGIKRTKAGTYLVTWRDPSGRSSKRTFPRRVDADRFAAEVEGSKVRGAYMDPTAGLMLFRDYAERYLAAKEATWRPTTIEQARVVMDVRLFPELGDAPLASITSTDLEALIGRLSRRYASATVEVTWSYARQVLRAAHRDRRIGFDPTLGVRLPRPADDAEGDARALVIPTRDEVTAIITNTPTHYRAAVALGAGCGLRIGEVLGLTADRIDLERGELRIDQQLQRINNETVLLPYTKTRRGRRTIMLPGWSP